jgi:hypothetical protein
VRCGIGCGPPPARPPVWLPQCLLVGSRQAWIENRPKSFAFETNSSKPSRTCMNMFRCPVQQICLLFPRTVCRSGTMVQTKPASPCAALLCPRPRSFKLVRCQFHSGPIARCYVRSNSILLYEASDGLQKFPAARSPLQRRH